MIEVKIFHTYRHKRTGDSCRVSELGKMKVGEEWLPCVIYFPIKNPSETFVREESAFKTNFEEIEFPS